MKLKNVSVTQYNTAGDCFRKWFIGWVMRIKSPPSESQQRGTFLHALVAHDIDPTQAKTDKAKVGAVIKDKDDYRIYVDALRPWFPESGEEALVEEKFFLKTSFGIPLIGVVDLMRHTLDVPIIRDWKSTSDLRYAATPDEVSKSPQLGTYAEWAYQEGIGDEKIVRAELVYVHVPKKAPKRKANTLVVGHDFTRTGARAIWNGMQTRFEKMLTIAETCTEAGQVEYNTETCYKYGGCGYRGTEYCSLSPLAGIGQPKHTPGKTSMKSFADRIKSKKEGSNAAPKNGVKTEKTEEKKSSVSSFMKKKSAAPKAEEITEETTETVEVKGAEGVVPPDAPPRDAYTTQEDVDAASPKKKVGRPKGSANKKTAKKTEPAKEGFVLYVDCIPAKGEEVVVLFEDWINPQMIDLEDELNIKSYWDLDFAGQKSAMERAVRDQIEKAPPPALVIDSSSGKARDALPTLKSLATRVVQSFGARS